MLERSSVVAAAVDEPMTLPEAVLWDMDGTLVDTEPYWIVAEGELVAAHGGTWTYADAMGLVGRTLSASGAIIQRAGVDLPVEEIVNRLIARVAVQVEERVPWCPGALELLAELQGAGVPCALVTMSYRSQTEPVLAQSPAGAISVVVSGDEVTHGKPHPEPYLTATRRLGVDITRCVAIEDSTPGITSALAAGARTIAVEQHVPVEPRPGLSRASSLERIDLAVIARVAAGGVVDLME